MVSSTVSVLLNSHGKSSTMFLMQCLTSTLTPTPKINASRLYSNGKWLIAHFLSSHCHTMCIMPWNTLVWWVTCKFVGFPDFVIHVHHCHQLCIFFKVRIPLLHKFCALKSFIVQFFLSLHSRACSNVLLCIFLHIVVAMCSKLVPSYLLSNNEHHAFKHSTNTFCMQV